MRFEIVHVRLFATEIASKLGVRCFGMLRLQLSGTRLLGLMSVTFVPDRVA